MNRSNSLLNTVSVLVFVLCVAWSSLFLTAQGQANKNPSTQTAAQKRPATLRANDSPEGSRVSISADGSLDEYEAYRRGDRFYVKLPSTDVSQAQANLRARGFQDVNVQKNGASTVLSFHLQPGTTARVDQKGNRLDVIFTTPGGSQGSTAPANANSGSQISVAAPANTGSNLAANAKTQPAPSTSAPNTVTQSNSNQPVSSRSPLAPTANQNTTAPASDGDSWLGSGDWRTRLKFYGEMARLNWLPIAIGLTLALLAIAVLLSRRAKSRHRKEIVSLPRKLKKTDEARVQAAPIIVEPRREQLSEIKPVPAPARESSTQKPAPTVVRPVEHEAASQAKVDVEMAQAEASSILSGTDYATDSTETVDSSAREVIATELLSALAGRNPERRARAREAFIDNGYFDDATRDLRVAEAPAERASAARKLALVRDFEATPHLVAALEDEAPEVRRAAVEALADLRDPSSIAPLNELLRTERDRKLPQSVIRHAIEACATVESTEPAQGFAPPNMVLPQIEPDREVIEI